MALTDKLDFVIAGAQKGGTTALHYFLEQHPRIVFPGKQELHFFDDEEHFARGGGDDALAASFGRVPPGAVTGECTPVYLYWEPALPRIKAHNPAIKIILTLRNPVERAFSHWNMQRQRDLEDLDFLDAIAAEPTRAAEEAPRQSRRYSYLDRGFYGRQVERLLTFFPREQLHAIRFDDLRADAPGTVAGVCHFLGVEPPARLKVREKNTIAYDRRMTARERSTLLALYADDLQKLEQLLGWDCSDWRNVPSS